MNLTLHIWRQKNSQSKGKMVRYEVRDINPDMSFLEMLDVVNWNLNEKGEEPIAFDHDCREGICGSCGMMINGIAHGPQRATAACQLHMRQFKEGDAIFIEPWRSEAFPVIRDLVVDRSAFDRIIQAGGYISIRSGAAPEANTILISKPNAELAMDAAACIGCGACVAACPNGSASLFTSAKIAHLNLLPQGQPERTHRVLRMVQAMDHEGFGNCTMHRECEAVCPKEISVNFIARMNREYLVGSFTSASSVQGYMATPFDIVTLFDRDNTLLDHDQVVADLRNHLEQEFGPRNKDRYFEIFDPS